MVVSCSTSSFLEKESKNTVPMASKEENQTQMKGGRGFIVAIDGPAGAGKSTISRLVAKRLGFEYLDTGALYRAIAWKLDREGILPEENESLFVALERLQIELKGQKIFVDGEDATEAIRLPQVDSIVSLYAALPSVRRKLLNLQKAQAKGQGLVADGRDIGTVVFPEAEVKIFLTASTEVRACRRFLERREKGEAVSFEEVLETIRQRDFIDSTRSEAPLAAAPDAVWVDTSALAVEEVVDKVVEIVSKSCERSLSHG